MFEIFKNILGKKKSAESTDKSKNPKKSRSPRKKKQVEASILSDKDLATKNGEPYVSIMKVDIDPENINSGSFELDWNDKFVLNLVRAGYKIKDDDSDSVIVDRWFQTVCRNIALEVYEQQNADPVKRDSDMLRTINRRDLGNGRSEIS